MIKVIGKFGCKSCTDLKKKLLEKGIDFDYELLEDLGNEEKRELIRRTREAEIFYFPIVLRNDELIANHDELFV